MNPIKQPNTMSVDNIIGKSIETKAKMMSGIKNHLFFIISLVVIVCALFVGIMKDINLTPNLTLQSLSIRFVILWFLNYVFYVNNFNAGTETGKRNQIYLDVLIEYVKTKKEAFAFKNYELNEFCENWQKLYIERATNAILYQIGISIEEYQSKYASLGKKEIKLLDLTDKQKQALIKTSAIKAPKLTPEMLERDSIDYSQKKYALGKNPKSMVAFTKFKKLLSSMMLPLLTASILIAGSADFSFANIVTTVIQIVPIIVSGAFGYKQGYVNIIEDNANYVIAQTDYLKQYISWTIAKGNVRI